MITRHPIALGLCLAMANAVLAQSTAEQQPAPGHEGSISTADTVHISIYEGDAQSTIARAAFATPLKVLVTGPLGYPAIGQEVVFSAVPGGPGITFGASPVAITNAAGIATSPALIANAVAGDLQVKAIGSGAQTIFRLQITNGNSADVASADSGAPAGRESPAPLTIPLNEKRILKVIPNFQTVESSSQSVAPMTAAEKWRLGLRQVVDPFNIANAAMTAAFSQIHNQTPSYGQGWPNYAKRFGAAIGDFGTQSFLSAGLFATVLHQDPRYFRKGPPAGVVARAWYSVTRLVVCRDDAGDSVFNATNLLGMSLGIAASNLYYPSASRTGTVMVGRIKTSMFGGVTGNLLSEFWPDIQRKFFKKRRQAPASQGAAQAH